MQDFFHQPYHLISFVFGDVFFKMLAYQAVVDWWLSPGVVFVPWQNRSKWHPWWFNMVHLGPLGKGDPFWKGIIFKFYCLNFGDKYTWKTNSQSQDFELNTVSQTSNFLTKRFFLLVFSNSQCFFAISLTELGHDRNDGSSFHLPGIVRPPSRGLCNPNHLLPEPE